MKIMHSSIEISQSRLDLSFTLRRFCYGEPAQTPYDHFRTGSKAYDSLSRSNS